MQVFALYPFDPPGDIAALRADLRRWLADNQPRGDVVARANCWASFDPDFSRALGAAGYIGMTLPARYGGGGRHPLQRYVAVEEMLALVRTEAGSERNVGLSQLLIDLDTPGITIRPIIDMAGHHDFNEVFFDDVLVPHGALVGARGEGWQQVTAELGLERSGPERYLSSHALFAALIDAAAP